MGRGARKPTDVPLWTASITAGPHFEATGLVVRLRSTWPTTIIDRLKHLMLPGVNDQLACPVSLTLGIPSLAGCADRSCQGSTRLAAMMQIMFQHMVDHRISRTSYVWPSHSSGKVLAQSSGVQRCKRASMKAHVSSRPRTSSTALRAGDPVGPRHVLVHHVVSALQRAAEPSCPNRKDVLQNLSQRPP